VDTYIAFLGCKCIANGGLEAVLRTCKEQQDALIFHEQTGKQVDFDFRGSIEDVLARVAPKPERTRPGRPRLGVISREISLLPRHWDWLETQPAGASAALRRLVDDARRNDPGNLPGFEEATRVLYARDKTRLADCIKDWPEDIRAYVLASPVK
jgi:hypothetical protein